MTQISLLSIIIYFGYLIIRCTGVVKFNFSNCFNFSNKVKKFKRSFYKNILINFIFKKIIRAFINNINSSFKVMNKVK